MILTENQVRFFRQSGYLRLSNVLDKELLASLLEAVNLDLENRVEPLQNDRTGRIARLDQLVQRGSIFLNLINSPPFKEPLLSLLGPNIELTLNRHNHATVNSKNDSAFRLHRDVLQWTRAIVTVIVYLEDADVDNGCTYLIPGSQYLPFVGTPNNGGTWMDEHHVYADLLEQAIPVPVKRGGMLLLDSLCFHSAGLNSTERTRVSLCFGFHSVDELDPAAGGKSILIAGERLYRGNDRGPAQVHLPGG